MTTSWRARQCSVALAFGLLFAGPALAGAQDLVLVGGHVVDVRTGTTRVASVLVRDGAIRAIGEAVEPGAGAQIIDVSGRWVVPGLVEAHTHVTDAARLQRALSLGVTSTLTIHTGSTFLPPDYEDRSHLPTVPLPRTYMVGGRFRMLTTSSAVTMSPSTPKEAYAQLDAYREQGVRRIKIWFDDGAVQFDTPIPTFDDRTVQALVSGAHARGMQVFFHALTADLFRRAVATGPSWMIHPIVRGRLTRDDVEALRAGGLGWTTVMSIVFWNGDPRAYARRVLADRRLTAAMLPATVEALRADAALDENPNAATRPRIVRMVDEYLDNVRRNTELAVAGGLPVAIGSDRPAGYGTHVELELLRDAGFDAATLLRAATEGGATALGVADRFGTIGVGKVADLVIVGSNPLEDIVNLRDVDLVIKGGRLWSVDVLRR